MIFIEKLSLFNIDCFRKLYKKNENAYICDKGFFEIYDDESFIVKYIIRKQIRLLKYENGYIGYIWYEYPTNNGLSNIYALYLKDEYIELIDSSILSSLKSYAFKFDTIDNLKITCIMNKLKFNRDSETILMKISSKSYCTDVDNKSITFRHFKNQQDENLRCDIQNSIFNEKGRTPLTINDIYAEEDEDYYIENYGVFICDKTNNPVGYGQIIYNNGIYTIVNLGIINGYRRQGYGEALVKYLIGLCYKDLISDVYIRVEKKNYRALALYTKIGFKEYGSFTTWYKAMS